MQTRIKSKTWGKKLFLEILMGKFKLISQTNKLTYLIEAHVKDVILR